MISDYLRFNTRHLRHVAVARGAGPHRLEPAWQHMTAPTARPARREPRARPARQGAGLQAPRHLPSCLPQRRAAGRSVAEAPRLPTDLLNPQGQPTAASHVASHPRASTTAGLHSWPPSATFHSAPQPLHWHSVPEPACIHSHLRGVEMSGRVRTTRGRSKRSYLQDGCSLTRGTPPAHRDDEIRRTRRPRRPSARAFGCA